MVKNFNHFVNKEEQMATNPPKGPGRIGAVKDRTQVVNPQNNRWIKRNTENGQFIDQKHDEEPFKGVTKEN
jgi:hypothetical protein